MGKPQPQVHPFGLLQRKIPAGAAKMFLISAVGSVCSDLFASSLVVTCRRGSGCSLLFRNVVDPEMRTETPTNKIKKKKTQKQIKINLPIFADWNDRSRPHCVSSIRFAKDKYSQNIVYFVIMNGRRGERFKLMFFLFKFNLNFTSLFSFIPAIRIITVRKSYAAGSF